MSGLTVQAHHRLSSLFSKPKTCGKGCLCVTSPGWLTIHVDRATISPAFKFLPYGFACLGGIEWYEYGVIDEARFIGGCSAIDEATMNGGLVWCD